MWSLPPITAICPHIPLPGRLCHLQVVEVDGVVGASRGEEGPGRRHTLDGLLWKRGVEGVKIQGACYTVRLLLRSAVCTDRPV